MRADVTEKSAIQRSREIDSELGGGRSRDDERREGVYDELRLVPNVGVGIGGACWLGGVRRRWGRELG